MPNRPEAVRALYDRFGPPGEQPRFYRELSSRTFFDRIADPVLMHHGTADETCPFPWATTTQRLLRGAGVDSRLEVYQGEQHAFVPAVAGLDRGDRAVPPPQAGRLTRGVA